MKTRDRTIRKGKGSMTAKTAVVIIAAVIIIGAVCISVAKSNRKFTVSDDIPFNKITEFYYTVSSSANPSYYQRYHFYADNDGWMFYHETRQGSHWPLTEKDATKQGTVKLAQQQVQQLEQLVAGGKVTKRTETAETGGKGPWMYLYWEGDKGKYQQFSFGDVSAHTAFENFCQQLESAQ